jgi:hypothetical protein
MSKQICCDDSGNVYVLGSNYGKATYGSTTLDSGSFVVKYSSAGNLAWAMHIAGEPCTIQTGPSGDLYILGNFFGMILIGPNQFVSYNARAFYLARFSASGAFQWSRSFQAPASTEGASMAIDSKEQIYVTGYYTDSLRLDSIVLRDSSSKCTTNFFLAKFTSSGNTLWATAGPDNTASTFYNYCNGYCIKLTKHGSVVVIGEAGYMWGADVFITRYDSSGNILYNAIPGGGDWSYLYSGRIFCFDDSSNIFHIWNSGTHYYDDPMLVKYDSALNNKWQLALSGGSYNGGFYDISHSPSPGDSGNIYLAGYLRMHSGDSLQVCNQWLKSKGGTDAVVGKFDRLGNCIWFKTAGGENDDGFGATYSPPDCSINLATDKKGNCFVTGIYNISNTTNTHSDHAHFDSNTLVNDGAWEQIFVAKLAPGSFATHVSSISTTGFLISPNPTSGNFLVQCTEGNYSVRVRNSLGDIVYSENSTAASTNINISNQPSGIYFVEVRTAENTITHRRIILE